MASGCKNLLESGIACEFVFFGRRVGQQAFHNDVLSDPLALGGEVDDRIRLELGQQALDQLGIDLDAMAEDVADDVADRIDEEANEESGLYPVEVIEVEVGKD